MIAVLFACPMCAQAPASSGSWILLGAFLALPFAIAALAIRAIRNVDS